MSMLIVDDDPEIGDFIGRVATDCGFKIALTTSAKSFLKRLESWQPSHLVIDLKMPDVDGIELLVKLAEDGCTANIVLISGADTRVLAAAKRIGRSRGLKIAAILSKPVRLAKLREIFGSLRNG